MAGAALGEDVLSAMDARLGDTDELLAKAYPGDDGRRQPVHTVYVPADRYTPSLPAEWGASALALVERHGGLAALAADLGLTDEVAQQVTGRVETKLRTAPIEDLRLDFEDGYGDRGDAAEDADCVTAAGAVADALKAGTSPDFIGIRFKCFEAPTRRRGIRTLDLFLGSLIERVGQVPEQLVITFPKVSTLSQVETMVSICQALESAHGLDEGALGFEIQVETPQIILGADGSAPVASAIHAAGGRVTSLHYGTYDYSASLQIAAEYQASDHPAADHAKTVMQLAVAGTGVHLSDGSTNVLPVGSADQVRSAWALHAALVERALRRGYYQGWDLHFGQLPTRYLTTFAFYRSGFDRAATRLANYVSRTDSAIMDEPATARALSRFLQRGHACGAIDESELISTTGLDAAAIAAMARPHSDTDSVRASA
jgi:hypothetical protein